MSRHRGHISRDVIRALKEGSASVGICWDAANIEGLASLPYHSDHLAVVVYPGHPLAGRKRAWFEETLEFDHVGLPASAAVQVMLARAAAGTGKTLTHRAIVSNFDAAMRVVRARLGISIVPREIAAPYAASLDLRVVPLRDAWARRRFAVCYRDPETLSPAARLLVDFLATRAKTSRAHEEPELLED